MSTTTKNAELPRLMAIGEAAAILGRPSAESLRVWIRRWNSKHPDRLVLTAHGRVDVVSLRAAIEYEVAQRTPSYQVAAALQASAAAAARRGGAAHE